MSFEIWLAFVAAATVILVIPGPTIILVISQAIAHGRRATIPLVTGVTLGDFSAMTASLLGLGAILSISAALFSILKWIGAFYLVYLGIKMWRMNSDSRLETVLPAQATKRRLFRSTYIVTALNPKSIVFFVAFVPQFVTPNGHALSQLFILGITFLFLATVNATLYAIFAGQIREKLQKSEIRSWFHRFGGTALIAAGILTATVNRSS
ncbi:MAG: LysE family translocator [bacterium]